MLQFDKKLAIPILPNDLRYQMMNSCGSNRETFVTIWQKIGLPNMPNDLCYQMINSCGSNMETVVNHLTKFVLTKEQVPFIWLPLVAFNRLHDGKFGAIESLKSEDA